MFNISLPVQRFVIGAVILMILIIIGNESLNYFWTFSDHAQDVILQSRTIS